MADSRSSGSADSQESNRRDGKPIGDRHVEVPNIDIGLLRNNSTNGRSFDDLLNQVNSLEELMEIQSRPEREAKIALQVNVLQKAVQEVVVANRNNVRLNETKQPEQKDYDEEVKRVMEEYEKTIATLLHENEILKKERETVQIHLANAEAAFSDVHNKYERCKVVIEGFRNNEQVLQETIHSNEENIVKLDNKYEALKTHAMGQLEKANLELNDMKKVSEDKEIRYQAQIKKLEVKIKSLQLTVDQCRAENAELTRICDDLISKVGK